jgi:hypothetical protein
MEKATTLFFCLVFCFANMVCQAQEHCGTIHQSGSSLAKNLPATSLSNVVGERMVVNIPVVVHVVYNTAAENISDEQILSQIEVLNSDFSASNPEIQSIVPPMFEPVVGNIGFRFCLATKDPDGNATTGISRTHTDNNIGIGGTAAIHYTAQGGHDAWPIDKYLNIWVAKFAGGIGGVATFPGEGPDAEQGIQISYKQFGTVGTAATPPYNLGRTATHEIGHYFNLEHVWGPNQNSCCTEDDGVLDTPVSCEDYLHECPSGTTFSCLAPDMWMNFMNYTDDACMAMFTLGQKQRMYEALENFRAGLLSSDGCQAVGTEEEHRQVGLEVSGNPAQDEIRFEIKDGGNGVWKVRLYNPFGQAFIKLDLLPNQSQSISCQTLPRGLYFLIASQNETHLTSRVMLD